MKTVTVNKQGMGALGWIAVTANGIDGWSEDPYLWPVSMDWDEP